MINIYVPDSKLIHRICGRRVCRDCGATYHESMLEQREGLPPSAGAALYVRDDDDEEVVRQRLAVYKG